MWPQLSGVPLFWATCLTDSVSFSWGSLASTHTISFLSLDSTTFSNTHRWANALPSCVAAHTLIPHTKKPTVYVSWEPLKLTVVFIITCCDLFSPVIYFISNQILISVPQPVIFFLFFTSFLLRFKTDSNLNDNLSPSEIDWVTSEWLCEQRSPPGNDGPVTTGTKGVMSKRRKRERRGKSQSGIESI